MINKTCRIDTQKERFHTKNSILALKGVIENCLPKTKGFIPKFKVFDFGIKIKVTGMKVIENYIPKRKGFIPKTQFFHFGIKTKLIGMEVIFNCIPRRKGFYTENSLL